MKIRYYNTFCRPCSTKNPATLTGGRIDLLLENLAALQTKDPTWKTWPRPII
jgi:hypothetical protein